MFRCHQICVVKRKAFPLFNRIEFFTTAATPADLPPATGHEVAFVGRSNAGKSSAINALAQRRHMAFISKTPGRTQHINFFRVGPQRFLVDLPGYGFAAIPDAARASWNHLVGNYLQTRTALRGIILVMDARRPLTALDQQLLGWLQPCGKPLHALLTKADKLSRQQASIALRKVEAAFTRSHRGFTAQLFSSTHKIGIVEAVDQINCWLEEGGRP